MAVNWAWADMWATIKVAPDEQIIAIGQELDNVPGGFAGWLKSRSPKVQIEILEGAPEWVQKNLYSSGVLKTAAVLELEIPPNAKVKDRRNR